MKRVLAWLVTASALAGCGTVDLPRVAGPEGPEGLEAPPPVTIRYDGRSAELEPWTFCYGNGCADGAPPDNPVDVGSPDQVIVDFPLDDWTFEASFTPAGKRCGRSQAVPLEERDGSFVVRPAGYADTYDVTLFGRGDGDLFVTFRWTTRQDGPLPRPHARLAVLADNDGTVDSYGVEMALSHLAATPSRVRAEVTVTASDGTSVTFEPQRSRGGCRPPGTIYWDGPDRRGHEAAGLPGDTFSYRVTVTLDGTRHVATARWPQDVIKGNEPSVRLRFDPPLPALRPR